MEIWDPDEVDALNVPTQMFRIQDIGRSKVSAMQEIIQGFIGTPVVARHRKWEPPVRESNIYVCAVDSMDTRIEIWNEIKKTPPRLYLEGRMGALEGTIYAVTDDPEKRERYEKYLYPSKEAIQLPCTAKATFFTGTGLGSIIAGLVYRFLTNQKVPFETIVNFEGLEVVTP